MSLQMTRGFLLHSIDGAVHGGVAHLQELGLAHRVAQTSLLYGVRGKQKLLLLLRFALLFLEQSNFLQWQFLLLLTTSFTDRRDVCRGVVPASLPLSCALVDHHHLMAS